MNRLAGIARSGDCGHHPPPPAASSSSSTLSPLAPPFTVDRWVPAVANPNSLPPPPPTGAISPYFVPTGDSVWSSSSSGASKLTNLSSGLGVVDATRYYPYYAAACDSVDGTLEKVLNYKGYVGGWSGTFDLDEGRPARGSVVNSSWTDSLASCQKSLALKKRGTVDSFSAYDDSVGSWHGAHNESSSTHGHVGSVCSEWLDDSHREIYVDKSRLPNDGSFAAEIDTTVWPNERSSYFYSPETNEGSSYFYSPETNEGSSYFYSPETTSVVKECDTFIPCSYDRYISQLSSCSKDPVVHYPAQTSSSRQGYVPSNERNESVLSCSVLKHGDSESKHVNLHRKHSDYADYVIGMQNEASLYENTEHKEVLEKMGKEGLERMAFFGDAMQRNSGNTDYSLPVNVMPSNNSSALGQSIDCLQDAKFGFKVTNLNCCNASNFESGVFMPNDSIQTSQEMPDHLNVAVDSPCWKGASVSRRYPFSSDEILQPLVINVTSGCDDLVQGHMSLKNQSDIEHGVTYVCNENGKDINLSPVTDLSGSDLKFPDCAERESNPEKVENANKIGQHDVRGEHISVLNEQVSFPQDIDDHVRQLSPVENINCKASSNTCETIPTVQSSDFVFNRISTSPTCSSSSSTNASNGEMNLSYPNAIFPVEIKKPVSSDAPSKCLSQGQDARVLVKAMLSLSEVLLCHCCNDNEVLELCDLKPVQQIIDNLEAVILQNKKGITGSSSRETQSQVKDSNAEMCSDKDLKDAEENKNAMSSGLNNVKHDDIAKSFSATFKASDGMPQVLKSGSIEQEEDPNILLYKNLWVQTEATLCSLKHDVALMKLEMRSLKNHFKAKSQASSDGLAEPHEGLNCATYIENPSRSDPIVEKNHKQKEDEIVSSVFARFRILKGRDEVLSGPDEPPELNAIKSYVDREKVREMKEVSPNLADVNAIEKGVLQSLSASKIRVAGPKKNMTGEKLPAGVQESLLSTSDGPKSHGKRLFSSGSGSPSSEWEHVVNDEFLW